MGRCALRRVIGLLENATAAVWRQVMPNSLKRESYFPTLIYYADIDGGIAINAALTPRIYEWRDEDPGGIVRSNALGSGAWHSKDDLVHNPHLSALVASILKGASEIFNDLGYDPTFEPRITNIWANLNARGGYNRGHTHSNTLWSGVYYIKAPKDCGNIVFHDPRAQALVIDPLRASSSPKLETWSEVYFQPMAGRLILFPSWLMHEVQPNMSPLGTPEGDRISVSFNIVQSRKSAR